MSDATRIASLERAAIDTQEYLDTLRAALASHDAAFRHVRMVEMEQRLAPSLAAPVAASLAAPIAAPIAPPAVPKAHPITMGGDVSQAGSAGALPRAFGGGLAVVACYTAGTVYVISVATKAVVAILGTEGTSYPFGVAMTPVGEYGAYAWVTSGSAYGPIYSLASFSRAGQILMGAYGITTSPDGAWAYTSLTDGSLYEFDTATKLSGRSLSAVGTAYGMAATADYLYLPLFSTAATLKVVRLLDFTVVATVSLSGYPWAAAVTPDGAYVYVSDITNDKVYVFRTSDNTLYATVTVGAEPRGLAVTPAGDYVWVALFGADAIQSIRVSDNVTQSPISVGSAPIGVAITPDGAEVWVSCSTSSAVYVVRASDGYVYTSIPVGSTPYGIAIGA